MAEVTVDRGNTGSDIALSNNDSVFYVTNGTIELSTDTGTTYIPFSEGEKVVFTDGLTIRPRCTTGESATFRHMPI